MSPFASTTWLPSARNGPSRLLFSTFGCGMVPAAAKASDAQTQRTNNSLQSEQRCWKSDHWTVQLLSPLGKKIFDANSNGTVFGLVGNTQKKLSIRDSVNLFKTWGFFLHCRPQTIQCSAISECSYVDRSNASACLGASHRSRTVSNICPTSMTGVSLASRCFAVSVWNRFQKSSFANYWATCPIPHWKTLQRSNFQGHLVRSHL